MRKIPAFVAAAATLASQANQALGFGFDAAKNVVPAAAEKSTDRRNFLASVAVTSMASSALLLPNVASAESLPSVTVTEFQEIIRDSAKSIKIVEFSGPRSEQAVAFLVDGTKFAITGLIDSPSDPRSPLKLAAICRASKIPTKFLTLELAISASGAKKKKSYANSRVQEAAAKEREKKARIEADEQERLAELFQQEEAEAAKRVATAATEATATSGEQ